MRGDLDVWGNVVWGDDMSDQIVNNILWIKNIFPENYISSVLFILFSESFCENSVGNKKLYIWEDIRAEREENL